MEFRTTVRCAVFLSLVLSAVSWVRAAEEDEGFQPIFNGKNLEGWAGHEKLWRVEDGAITGQTTKENPTKGNTFLIWKEGEIDDFELKLQYRIVGGNSGIQYRSFDMGNFVVSGHQADFEAGNTWSGAHYEEKGRGILAARGQKTEVSPGKKVKVVEQLGDGAKMQSHIKKEDWNEYHIIAQGNRMIHKINGVVMSDVTDNGGKESRNSGILAVQLHAGPPMTVQFKDIRLKRLTLSGKKKVVFIAGRDSHGKGAHEHRAGCTLLALALNENMPQIQAIVHHGGWPKDPHALENADAIVMYADGGGGHPVIPHLDAVDALNKKGVGIVCLHYGVEVPKGPAGERFLDWTGGYFETNWSVNPHWIADFKQFPDHPVSRGVKPFAINDEWYYHMRFRDGMKGVTPILTAMPPKETLSRGDGAHSGNPHVRAAIQRGEAQHVAWASEQEGRGRGFGFTGGHFHWNWGDDNFRTLVLNGIAWAAGADVPAQGVPSSTLSKADLEGLLGRPPAKQKKSAAVSRPQMLFVALKPGAAAKPLYSSPLVTPSTAKHAVAIDADVSGAKHISLVVTDGGDSFACDWADWAEPRFVVGGGEKRLTDLKWKSATTGWGQVRIGENAQGGPLRIAGKSVPYGIGTHANSIIVYEVPAGATRFLARGGLDNGGTDQGACGGNASVQFAVYKGDLQPAQVFRSAQQQAGGNTAGGQHDPAGAVQNLDVHEQLEATLYASEPMMLNPSNIDIDHRGRVWVCEIVNYRGHNNKRPEGDRILILEDTDGDGKADSQKVFYQGRDIDSPHGICVLGNKVIVSAGANVFVMTDSDGDDVADKKETLFTGIGGSQHDHGIHAFVFGPDGKLYFNFGNAGNRIQDKDGIPITDTAGNVVAAQRKPYQDGMVFRCNLDGSHFETLGWNFRNNWMVTVDSFGTIWQSDNDDDGNKGVRINYVMEFGNYGYKDEKTGAGWNSKRTGMHAEVPHRHWHVNDPGVVPNLLLTGAGSPTGITVYEGDLLPEVFHGQVIHCDAGPNVTRAYPVTDDGAGYKAEMVNILFGARDNWFRPADVSVAPDGSLIVADWYDPGVGGHGAGHINSGRLFRVTPKGGGGEYTVPKFDFDSVAGAARALTNSNYAVRYLAWTALHKVGAAAEPALQELFKSDNPRHRARALWLLGKIEGRGSHYVNLAIRDQDPNIRIVGIRLARQLEQDVIPIVKQLVRDPDAQVRRELAIALRHNPATATAELWAELALQHDGKDRWYLEALGIGADGQWDACFAAWWKKTGEASLSKPAVRDIVWRSRATAAPMLLAKIIKSVSAEEHPRYYRALDFHSGPEKDQALQAILLP